MRFSYNMKKTRLILAPVFLALLLGAAVAWSESGSTNPASPHNKSQESWNHDACATCHSTHTAKSKKLVISENRISSICLTCHNGTWPPAFPGDVNNPDKVHSFGADSELGCNGCHQMHPPYRFEKLLRRQYTAESLGENINLSQNTSDYLLCLDCHNSYQEKGASDIARYYLGGTGHYIRNQGGTFEPGWQLSCSNCHDVHGSDNNKYVRNSITVQAGPGPDPGSATLPVNYASAAQIRDFCLTCHTTGRYLYRLLLQLPATISEHTLSGSESCTDCHGHVPGQEAGKWLKKGIHAPIVPPPSVSYTTTEMVYNNTAYYSIEFTVFHDGSHLASQKHTPFVNRDVVFQIISGDGTLQMMTGTVEEPEFTPVASPYSTVTGTNGTVSIWAEVPTGTTVVRVTTGSIVRDVSLTPSDP